MWLGSYPQTEVKQGDEAYEDLQAAEWADGDATVGGVRYRRIARSDATYSGYWSGDGYGWAAYRYFRYEPIRDCESGLHEKGYSHLNKRGTPLAENRGNPHPSWKDYPRFLTKGVPLLFKWEYPFS